MKNKEQKDDATRYICPECDALLYTAEYGSAQSDSSEEGLICEESDCQFEVFPEQMQDFCEPA